MLEVGTASSQLRISYSEDLCTSLKPYGRTRYGLTHQGPIHTCLSSLSLLGLLSVGMLSFMGWHGHVSSYSSMKY